MLISELEASIGSDGALVIPAAVIEQMGLRPNDNVYVAYIADDALKDRFRELLISPNTLGEIGELAQISIPEELLRDANIPKEAEVQIICIDGAIILCRESVLYSDGLTQILQSLDIAVDLVDHLPQDAQTAIESLRQYIDSFEEKGDGEYEAEE